MSIKCKSILTVSAALSLALCAQAQAEIVGINVHLPSEEELDMAQALGVRWVRIDNNWFQSEPRQGEYQWGELDRVVDGARRRGMAVMMTVAYTPAWASEGDGDGFSGNDTPREGAYARFVEATVRRYQDRVTHYGIWNEPNLRQFWAGGRAEYLARVLRPGAAAVRAACPECRVLGPDLAGLSDWQGALAEILREAPGAFDILTHHSYAAAPGARSVWLCDDLAHAMDIGQDLICFYKPGLRQVLDEQGWSGEVWLTETGYQAEPWDSAQEQERQRATVEGTLALQREIPWWTATFFYELSDCGPVVPGCGIDGFGLARRTGGGGASWEDNHLQKPAFVWLREALRDPYWGQDAAPPDPPDEARPVLEAPRREDGAPDGDLAEWGDEGCALLTGFDALTGRPEGTADLSARACAAWSPAALWLAVEVVDDRHQNDEPPQTRWDGDSLQLALDVAGDAVAGAGYDEDDIEWTLALSNGESALAVEAGPGQGAAGAVRREGDRTRYELRVPLEGLAAGRALRGSFLLNEDDGQGREGWLEWTPGIGRAKEPWRFGELRLSAEAAQPPPEPDAGRPDDADAAPVEDTGAQDVAPPDLSGDALLVDANDQGEEGDRPAPAEPDAPLEEGGELAGGEDQGGGPLSTQPGGGCAQAPGSPGGGAGWLWCVGLAILARARIRSCRGR
jgi:hypothetical protein